MIFEVMNMQLIKIYFILDCIECKLYLINFFNHYEITYRFNGINVDNFKKLKFSTVLV